MFDNISDSPILGALSIVIVAILTIMVIAIKIRSVLMDAWQNWLMNALMIYVLIQLRRHINGQPVNKNSLELICVGMGCFLGGTIWLILAY